LCTGGDLCKPISVEGVPSRAEDPHPPTPSRKLRGRGGVVSCAKGGLSDEVQVSRQHRRAPAGRPRAAEGADERGGSALGVLRDRQLRGIKFRRQYAVKRFIFDFYCPAARLVIELDGSIHDEQMQQERDAARTEALEAHRYRVIRFRNEEVFNDLQAVLDRIAAEVEQGT
jgi:very-short-patch-repair endonuclease